MGVRRIVSPLCWVAEGADQELADALVGYLAESTTDVAENSLSFDGWEAEEDDEEEIRHTNPKHPGVVLRVAYADGAVPPHEALFPAASALSEHARKELAADMRATIGVLGTPFGDREDIAPEDDKAAEALWLAFAAFLEAL